MGKISGPRTTSGTGVGNSAICSYSKEPQPGVGNSSAYGGTPSTKNRKSRPISGPSYTTANTVNYKGT